MKLSAEEIDQLVTKNVKLAYGMASSFTRQYRVEEEEASNVALAALVKAANEFDPDLGSNFASLAGRYIRNALRHMVKMPQGHQMLKKVELDAPVGDEEEGGTTVGHEVIGSDQVFGGKSKDTAALSGLLRHELEIVLQGASPEKRELVNRFVGGATYRQLANELTQAGRPISFVRVGVIIQKELDKVRKRLADKGIQGSLELEGLSWLDQAPLKSRSRRLVEFLSRDALIGGVADNKPIEDFDAVELERGQEVEKEHTNDPEVAQEIASDHIAERPDYYDLLKAIGLAGELEADDPKDKLLSGDETQIDFSLGVDELLPVPGA